MEFVPNKALSLPPPPPVHWHVLPPLQSVTAKMGPGEGRSDRMYAFKVEPDLRFTT